MNGMNPLSTDQWIQQYPNAAMVQSCDEPSDDTAIQVHRDSTQGTIGHTGPKPTRRRSRASRRTPTTVLNASPTDFRALVQRFTGCDTGVNVRSGSLSAPVVNLPKGPLNIDFARTDMGESSSRYTYVDSQLSSRLQGEEMQSVGGFDHLQVSYGMENAAVVYECIDESMLAATRRDGGGH